MTYFTPDLLTLDIVETTLTKTMSLDKIGNVEGIEGLAKEFYDNDIATQLSTFPIQEWIKTKEQVHQEDFDFTN